MKTKISSTLMIALEDAAACGDAGTAMELAALFSTAAEVARARSWAIRFRLDGRIAEAIEHEQISERVLAELKILER